MIVSPFVVSVDMHKQKHSQFNVTNLFKFVKQLSKFVRLYFQCYASLMMYTDFFIQTELNT